MDEIAPDIDGWATGHGFTEAEWAPRGRTPLLREGVFDVAGSCYSGTVDARDVVLAEYSIGSPGASEVIGGGGVDSDWFTLLLAEITDPGFRRLTIHPHGIGDRDWWNRLRGRDSRRETGDEAFDDGHQVIASSDLDDAEFSRLIDALREVLAAQPDLLIEVERDPDSDVMSLLVALPGLGLENERLDALDAAFGRALAVLDPA
jgi:hypothetical protein